MGERSQRIGLAPGEALWHPPGPFLAVATVSLAGGRVSPGRRRTNGAKDLPIPRRRSGT